MQRPTYQELIDNGCSHNMAEILSSGQIPNVRTDVTFLKGLKNEFVSKDHEILVRRLAKKEGVDTNGKVYLSQLAERPGDPKAWVSSRHDVMKVCEERNWALTGMAGSRKIDSRDDDYVETPNIPIAEDLVDRHTRAFIHDHPEAAKEDKSKVREMVKEAITPSWNKQN